MITLAFTRPSRRLRRQTEDAEAMGFRVLSAPSLDIVHGDAAGYADASRDLRQGAFDTVVFSSATAAEECRREWGDDMSRMLEGTEVIAIGPCTASVLEDSGIGVAQVQEEHTSRGLAEHLRRGGSVRNVLTVHSDRGSPVLRESLEASGARVGELVAYRLEKHTGGLEAIRAEAERGGIDVFAFTSRLSVESFLDSIGLPKETVFSKAKVAAIGPPTQERLQKEGIHVDIIPEEATFACLLGAIKDYFEKG